MPRYQVPPGMSHTVAAPSPPQTPVTTSPVGLRKTDQSPHHQRVPNPFSFSRPFSTDTVPRHTHFPNSNGAGPNAPLFRSNAYRPGDLSPSSSDMSSGLEDIDEDDEDEEEGDEDADAEDEDEDDDDDEPADSDDDDADDSSASASPPRSASSGMPDHRPNLQRVPPQQRPPPGSFSGFDSPMSTTSDDDDRSADEFEIEITEPPEPFVRPPRVYATYSAIAIEELLIFDSNRYAGIEVLYPDETEDAETELEGQQSPRRSRKGNRTRTTKTRARSPIDHTVVNGFQDLTCRTQSDEEDEATEAAVYDDDSSSGLEDDEFYINLVRLREEKRRRRMTSGSIGKRTISESIGSDTDNEDMHHFLDATEVGSSARRLRRRMDNRHSLQFTDPPAPRIDELEEPDTTEDELIVEGGDTEKLARELPYYTLEVFNMEVDAEAKRSAKTSADAS